MESSDALDSREETMDIPGDGWWPQAVKQGGNRICERFLCNVWKKRDGRQKLGGISIGRANGAPSRNGYVINGQTTEESTK